MRTAGFFGCARPAFLRAHMQTDQDRQLKLLPDLQAQAEQQRRDVELKHVEAEALKKQVAALQNEVEAAKRRWWHKWFASSSEAKANNDVS